MFMIHLFQWRQIIFMELHFIYCFTTIFLIVYNSIHLVIKYESVCDMYIDNN